MRIRGLAAAAATAALAAAALTVPLTTAAAASSLCGSMAGTPSHITKVLWIAMENQSYGNGASQIPGSASDPYIKNTLTAQCGSASNFHAATHPSYPNYFALTSGSTQNHFSDSLTYITGPSIFSQVEPSWRGYEEFMPTPCDHVFQTGTNPPSQYYLGRHNPAASYSDPPVGAPGGSCATNDIPMGTTTTGALHDDAANGTLPKFSLITPGLCDDMHAVPAGDTSCPDQVKGGDNWLATWIPILTSSPDYVNGNLLIDIVWDEGHGGSAGDDCINSSLSNCIVPNLVLSPYTTPVVSNTNTSQYSLLKTTEKILGVPFLGHAADASTVDLCAPYGICPPANPQPTASFTSTCQALSCDFNGSASTAPGSSITDYAWTFGDGGTGSGATPHHDYAADGTYDVTLTVTTAGGLTASITKSVSVSDSAVQPIAFVASAGAAGSTASPAVTIPSTVHAGDVMVLNASAATTSPPTAPAGWTLAGNQPSSVMGTSVWTKVATASDPGHAVTVSYPAAVKSTLAVAAYSGVDPTAPVAGFAAKGTHATASAATTPPVAVPAAGDWVVSSWSVKSSAVNAWTAPSGYQARSTVIGTSGGRISSLLADPGTPAPAGPAGNVSASTDQPFSASTSTSLVLAPACSTGCTPPPSIALVGASGVTKNAATETVTVPAGVSAGNGLVLIASGVTTGTLAAPAGWTLEKSQPNTVMTTSVWSKVATNADAGSSVTVTFPAQVKGTLQVLAYSGTNATHAVAAVTGAAAHATATTAVTPSLTAPSGAGWLVSYWAAKSSAVTAWTTSSAVARNSAIGTGGGQLSALVADSNSSVAAGPVGGLIASTDQPFSAADTLSILLAPSA